MGQTGQTVTLKVAKQGAIYYGLGLVLGQPLAVPAVPAIRKLLFSLLKSV